MASCNANAVHRAERRLQPSNHAVQGIESNVKHHRRLLPIWWPEEREHDMFRHFPHGGRLDARFRIADNWNDSMTVGLDPALTYDDYTSFAVNDTYHGDVVLPAQHFSHMLNYDYWKTYLPSVRTTYQHLLVAELHGMQCRACCNASHACTACRPQLAALTGTHDCAWHCLKH